MNEVVCEGVGKDDGFIMSTGRGESDGLVMNDGGGKPASSHRLMEVSRITR